MKYKKFDVDKLRVNILHIAIWAIVVVIFIVISNNIYVTALGLLSNILLGWGIVFGKYKS